MWSHLLNHKVLAEFQYLPPLHCHHAQVVTFPGNILANTQWSHSHLQVSLSGQTHFISAFFLSWFIQNSHKSKRVLALSLPWIFLYCHLYGFIPCYPSALSGISETRFECELDFFFWSYFLRTSIIIILQSTRHVTNYSHGLIESCICDNFSIWLTFSTWSHSHTRKEICLT